MITVQELLSLPHYQKVPLIPKFTYFGAGARNKVVNEWVEILGNVNKYVDVMAGSCNLTYAVGARKKVPVTVNDISYYSFCVACGLFHRQKETDLNKVAGTIVDALHNDVEGYFTWIYGEEVSEGFAHFIDSLIHLIEVGYSPPDVAFLKACLGHVLSFQFSIRGLRWYRKRDIGIVHNNGEPANIEKIAKSFFRCVRLKNKFFTEGYVNNLQVADFILNMDMRGATVCFDLIWPFKNRDFRVQSPYDYYAEIGEILEQKQAKLRGCWESDEPEFVLKEFTTWVEYCFMQGAREVYIWTQDTNIIPKETLFEALNNDFLCTQVFSTGHPSSGGKRSVLNYIFKVIR